MTMTEPRIEGFCYCLCGHTAGKHTTPDPKSESWKCREPGCICKKYQHSKGTPEATMTLPKFGTCDGCGERAQVGECGICGGKVS